MHVRELTPGTPEHAPALSICVPLFLRLRAGRGSPMAGGAHTLGWISRQLIPGACSVPAILFPSHGMLPEGLILPPVGGSPAHASWQQCCAGTQRPHANPPSKQPEKRGSLSPFHLFVSFNPKDVGSEWFTLALPLLMIWSLIDTTCH